CRCRPRCSESGRRSSRDGRRRSAGKYRDCDRVRSGADGNGFSQGGRSRSRSARDWTRRSTNDGFSDQSADRLLFLSLTTRKVVSKGSGGLDAGVVVKLNPSAAHTPNDSPAAAPGKLGKLFRAQTAKKFHLARMSNEMLRALCQSLGDDPRDWL